MCGGGCAIIMAEQGDAKRKLHTLPSFFSKMAHRGGQQLQQKSSPYGGGLDSPSPGISPAFQRRETLPDPEVWHNVCTAAD